MLGVGLGAGVLSGMFGIGGGIVIVPILVGLLKFDQKVAVGTSLGALLLPVGFGGVSRYYAEGLLDVGAAAAVALGLVIGSFGGAKLALGLPSTTVKRLYGIFLLFVAARFIFPDAFGV
ncbi:MAG: permease [Phototrophicales bacterium]|nr:MAG: permease [Phototrophicales bacterium]